ncbi:transducin beta-like protein 2 [Portunus trituberculatus]|uniref:transducin beta-like protein 2 n=1 Tax=Portunus trituberculatus TaxID=210409 RepID=UPI001E1CB6A3|nr:transducin beta-like protein 2 [Portunus trituberculatus]
MVSVAALGLFQQVITQCVPYLCCSCSREAPRLVAHLLNAAVWCGAVRCGAGLTVWCRVGGVVSAGPGRSRGVAHAVVSEQQTLPPCSTLGTPRWLVEHTAAHHPTQKHKTIAWRRRNTPNRTVQIWTTKDFSLKEHKSVRGNIEFDYATKVCWSPDGKAVIIHKSVANTIEVYKLTKRPDGSPGSPQMSMTFPQHDGEADVIALDMAVTGKFIMSCNNKNQLIIWSLRGEVMEMVDTRHGDTYSATLSPCGRFVATTGFTPDVKVWEVKFGKTGNFEGIKRAYDLTGHKAGIYSCSINSDSTRMVSVSKDGTWRLFDTNIEYQKGQLVYLLKSGPYENKQQPALIRLSPDGRTFVIASTVSLTFYSAITGDILNNINDIYAGNIVDLLFDPESKLLLTLGDRHVRVFHNVAGYHATIQDLEQSHKKATSASMRDRVNQQVKEAKKALEMIQRVTRVKTK